jgi:hypothetical protein
LNPHAPDAQNGIIAGHRLALPLVQGVSNPPEAPFCAPGVRGILAVEGVQGQVPDHADQPGGVWIWFGTTCGNPTHRLPVKVFRPTGDAITHCPAGHEYTPENNLKAATGGKKCRKCHNLRRRVTRAA